MMKNNTLQELYGLEYVTVDNPSSLIDWYNMLVDKTILELNYSDVARMIRQDILKNVAIERAVDLFLINPFDGEWQDGDLLELLIVCGSDVVKCARRPELIVMAKKLEDEIEKFDWIEEEDYISYKKNLAIFEEILLLR